MALSFAFHGLAVAPLLFAETSVGVPADDPAFVVEVSLAAPAPSDALGPTAPLPTEDSVDLPMPNEPRPVDVADVTPPSLEFVETIVDIPPPDQPRPVETAEIAERKVELRDPQEPPSPVAAELKPVTPPKSAEPPKPRPPAPPEAQPKPRPAAHANTAPVRPTQSPARTQTESAPNTGTARVTQAAAAQQPTIVWEHHPRFRTPPRPAIYPPRAIELGQQGEALVRVRLQPNGDAAEILLWRGTGHELLDKAALTAVRGWQFLPAMRQGHAVAAWVDIPVRFHLR